jgi:hypothetical protein
MITSHSTYEEIAAQIAVDEKNIQDFLVNKLGRERKNLMKIFKVKKYYTPSKPATFHSHATGIHWRILQILMHNKKPTAIERAQGLTFIVESENRIKYTIIDDMDTGQPILALTYPNQTYFVSAHAIRRYRERSLLDDNISFEAACDTLVRHSPYYVCYPSQTYYGSTSYRTIAFRVADGLFLGYYNNEKEIAHLETFISVEMLNEKQKSDSAFEYNDELLKKQRDLVLGKIPFDEELSASLAAPSSIQVKSDEGMKVLTSEEVDELARLSKDEYFAISEEERQRQLDEEQEANRERYDRKMKRKGYK